MDFDQWEKEKFYFCGWYRHKKGFTLLFLHKRNLENFKNFKKGQNDKARANRRGLIVLS